MENFIPPGVLVGCSYPNIYVKELRMGITVKTKYTSFQNFSIL
jgi:hypothetical protein